MSRRICKLDAAVVHKIAAGEIIVSPANALKELIENSLDAGATNIDVLVKDGGFKLLQVTDNGHGIDPRDLDLLCERFATSKISSFNDLNAISTLGFRGEALASISHIAHLSVKSKTAEAKVATRAAYSDNKLLETKKMAGVTGTQIIVEDLFYNVPLRSQALRPRASDEYQRILDVVSRYAIHYSHCTFSCKRHSDSQALVVGGPTQLERLRKVFGSSIASQLESVNVESHPSIGLQGAKGFATGLNYHSKKSTPFVFFINDRLVSNDALSRGIRKLYQQHLPRGGHAFVFLSLSLDPANVDVNVHPTKREVQFLYEPEIVNEVCNAIEHILTATDSSRDYNVQSYIASTTLPAPAPASQPASSTTKAAPRYEYKLVRTDPKQQTLTNLARPTSSSGSSVRPSSAVRRPPSPLSQESASDELDEQDKTPEIETAKRIKSVEPEEPSEPQKKPREVKLGSIIELRDELRDSADPRLTTLFADHTLIGFVDKKKGLAAMQHDVRLYLVDYLELSRCLFYQLGLSEFSNYGTVHLGDGLPLKQLLKLANSEATAEQISAFVSMAPMLEDYFSLVLRKRQGEWALVQLPLILTGYHPVTARLPQFIADMVHVDYTDEKQCFEGVIRALAELHVPAPDTSDEQIETVFEATKVKLIATKRFLPGVIEIANLPGLYRVFERC